MTYEILFWYTGATVWVVLALAVSLLIVVGAAVGALAGFHAARRWAGLRAIRKRITDGERELIDRTWPPLPKAVDRDALLGWCEAIGAREKRTVEIEAEKCALDKAEIVATYRKLRASYEVGSDGPRQLAPAHDARMRWEEMDAEIYALERHP